MSEETSQIAQIKVLHERLGGFAQRIDDRFTNFERRIDQGFGDLKEMIATSSQDLVDHTKDDEKKSDELIKKVEALTIDLAVFKTRWSILSAVGAAIISAGVSLAFKLLLKSGGE